MPSSHRKADLPGFLARCVEVLGPAAVVTDPDVVAGQSVDWTGRWRGDGSVVLRPADTAQVAAVVAAARAFGVGLVPQGGNTGLVGGSVPRAGEAVVDLRRVDALGPVDAIARQVTVGAGATLARVSSHVAVEGLAVGVDLAARDSATIGGMVATNAGGLHVLRHGTMRAQVLGLEAVLGTGAVVASNLTGLAKDNTGYDLAGLLCGSEGTLGIVTGVRLRLVHRPARRAAALLGFPHVAAAVAALPALGALDDLQAVELVLAGGLRAVADHLGLTPPLLPVPACAVLVEVAGDVDPLPDLAATVDALGAAVTASAVAGDEAAVARLWQWREAHSTAAAALGTVHKADVTVPLAAMAAFVDDVPRLVATADPSAVVLVYGHLADGNVHVNVVGPADDDERAIDRVLDAVLAVGGSVSAEHGVGVAKRRWMERQRGTAAVDAMRSIKAALDPDGILNPGVLLP